MHTLSIRTSEREQLIDITREVQNLVNAQGWQDGMLLLYCPHTTGAVTIKNGAY
ncbi:YjbQ family protein [Desulfovibrio subterraneus]|uniref:Uncharacterized protein n=1 Tax=Desulfovibrio subterraneus TaxID=2718620 RepID=A0A7J0BGR7_9BACT|nr:YjbQ family protein [Desulfovibrio subterraneus]GFM32382.1 hypothetical protein DSM101010T_07470 [Desulfovibrio subterraneus]